MAVGHGLVDHDLWTRGVDDAGSHEVQVHKMHTHGTGVRSADASKQQGVPFCLCHRDILETLGVVADNLQKRALDLSQLLSLRVCFMRVPVLSERPRGTHPCQEKS